MDIEPSDMNSSLVISVFALMSIKDASETENFPQLNVKIQKDPKVNIICRLKASSLLKP